MINSNFTYVLSQENKNELNIFFDLHDHISIDQNIEWAEITVFKKKCYFTLHENNELIGYCIIHERMKFAFISFGPISLKRSMIPIMIEMIFKYYKKLNFGQLVIQPGWTLNHNSSILNEISKKKPFQIDKKNNWCTINIKLNNSDEEILSQFSTNHKRSIKKAVKFKLSTKRINSMEDVIKLSVVYKLMCDSRKIISPLPNPKKSFVNIFDFLQSNNKGFILGVYNQNDELLGGIIIIYQGNTAFYYFGASSPKFKKLPILHTAFFEAIKISKINGLSIFDFGGYSKKGEKQMIGINRFKDGFKGDLIEYPQILIFKTNYINNYIIVILRKINTIWSKRKHLINLKISNILSQFLNYIT